MNTYYEIKNEYIQLSRDQGGVLYTPKTESSLPATGIVLIHSDSDYYGFLPAPELAKRGFVVLASKVSVSRGPFENKLLDVARAVQYLKDSPLTDKIVLLGHSGGATLMSAYQAVAENGEEIFQDDHRIVKMNPVGTLPRADALMLLDSNWGNGVMTLLSLDPSVTNNQSSRDLNPEYDLFSEENGFRKDGARYEDSFVKKYQQAQAERNDSLIGHALTHLDAIENGTGDFEDDEPFIIAGGSQIAPNNRLFPQDIRYLAHTQDEYDLLHGDGSITHEVIHSLRRPHFDRNFVTINDMATDVTTIRTFLSCSAVRTSDFGYDETHIYGIDWDSSFSCTPGNIQHVSAPLLIMGMTGSYEFLAAEEIYRRAASPDKTIAFVEGASHNFTPQEDAVGYPFGDTAKTCFDYTKDWLQRKGF